MMGAIALIMILGLALLFTWLVVGFASMLGLTLPPIAVFIVILILIVYLGEK